MKSNVIHVDGKDKMRLARYERTSQMRAKFRIYSHKNAITDGWVFVFRRLVIVFITCKIMCTKTQTATLATKFV